MDSLVPDACLIGGFAAFVVGIGWRFGIGWALISGGLMLMALGAAAYRRKARRAE
jgi:hypothetical protein